MSAPIPEHSPLPWRSVYPLGSKQRCAAVASDDHYVYLYVAESDASESTVRMHQANADLIANAQDRISALETQVGSLGKSLSEALFREEQWRVQANELRLANDEKASRIRELENL